MARTHETVRRVGTKTGGDLLDELAVALSELTPRSAAISEVFTRARARALRLAEAPAMAASTFIADVLSGLWLEREWTREEIEEVLARAADLTGFPPGILRVAVYLGLPTNHHIVELPPRLATEAMLGMLLRFAPVTEASVWVQTPAHTVECRLAVGGEPSRRGREVARAAIANGSSTAERALLHAVAITRWGDPHAALVVRTRSEDREEALAYAAEVATALGPLLETEALLERNAGREQALVGAAERRLVRLGADIHDGPLQELAALASDLRLFRSQVGEVLEGEERRPLVLGRIDDLEARLIALDRELRDLSSSLASPGIMIIAFPNLLRSEVESFAARTGIRVDLTIDGKFELLTASQRIALLRVVREALHNVKEHSGVSDATVELVEARGHMRVRICDEGAGFDVEQRLVEAARAGRLGLVGMGERIRLLGGRFDVDSQVGGPTVVSASIPRWQPHDRDDGGLAVA